MKKYLMFVCYILAMTHAIEKNTMSLSCEENLQLLEPALVTRATNLRECGLQCAASSACYSFTFSAKSKECRHDNHKFRHTGLVGAEQGSLYCGQSEENPVLVSVQKPGMFVQGEGLCPSHSKIATFSQLEEANLQGLHYCMPGWVKESADFNNPQHVMKAYVSSQSDTEGCGGGSPGVYSAAMTNGLADVWCVAFNTLTGNSSSIRVVHVERKNDLDKIALASQWILDPGLTNQV